MSIENNMLRIFPFFITILKAKWLDFVRGWRNFFQGRRASHLWPRDGYSPAQDH